MALRIELPSSNFYLSEVATSDREALVQGLNNPLVYEGTLSIPSPYTLTDADIWIGLVRKNTETHGKPINLALRNAEGQLVGSIGYMGYQQSAFTYHVAEIGYWLAEPYWGQGLMLQALKVMVNYGFQKMLLTRIEANVFSTNKQSLRLLEKAGFQQEGIVRKRYLKNGQTLDGVILALLKSEHL